MSTRISLPQFDIRADMWLTIERDDSSLVVRFAKENYISRRLKYFKSRMNEHAHRTLEQAMRLCVHVLRLGRVVRVILRVLLFSEGPRLVGDFPVGRVHYPARRRLRGAVS